MNILILTGKFGMGHWSASQSLRQQLMEEDGDHRVDVVDFVEYAMPGSTSEAVYRFFTLMVTHGSGIFNIYYKMTENMETDARSLFERRFVDKLAELVDDKRPDAVIATHPLCAQMVARYKWETGSSLPLVTSITDLTAHSEWINQGTDLYLVGAPAIADRLADKGVERKKIVATGIPVKAQFKNTPHVRGGETRHLLIMGGGLGLMPKKEKFYEELNALPGVETTIIAGNNEKLRQRLEEKYEHIRVVGYTDRVYDYMANADLLLSKPGGITLFETIASELPILAWEPFLQQEINNGHFMTRAGIGAVAGKEIEDCLEAIGTIIHNDGVLSWMAGNMRRLKSRLNTESLTEHLAAILDEKGVRVQ